MLSGPKWTLVVFHCTRNSATDGVKTIQKPDLADEGACKELGENIKQLLRAEYAKLGVNRPQIRYTYFRQT